jgi:hypothetical protein
VQLPSPRSLIVLAVVTVGVLAVGGAYAAASPAHKDAVFNGCVNTRSGVLRMIDPANGGTCITRRGPAQETPIWWSQQGHGAPGPSGPAGPPGPRGPAREDGGENLTSLEDLAGLPCDEDGPDAGVVKIRIYPPEQGSGIQLTCKTERTVETRTTAAATPRPPDLTTEPAPQPTTEPTQQPTVDPTPNSGGGATSSPSSPVDAAPGDVPIEPPGPGRMAEGLPGAT